ncbi:MAG: hypothetical protein AAF490_01800 [Chloroflexota bacterium]
MNEWVLEQEIEFLGTVSEVSWSAEAGGWLASPAGLFHQRNGRWQLVQKQVPFWHLNSVTVQDQTVLAAGLPKGILRSAVGGQRWEMAWVEQTERPITCLLPSPNLARDGVWLAGTQGDGVLRSTDNGRHWELVNWGLRDFTIIDLIAPPNWGEREFVFAITAEGVYQSPNGGRAWRYIGDTFESDPVQACAVSRNFAEDHTVWMGSENGGLCISVDKGRTWQTAVSASTQFPTITTLSTNQAGDLIIGAGSEGIFYSKDKGQTFVQAKHPTLSVNQPILNLCFQDEFGFAGLLNGGLWQTNDDGLTWTAASGLTAGRFMWLAKQNESTVVGGPHVGVWQNNQQLGTVSNDPILAMGVIENGRYLSHPNGVSFNGKLFWQSDAPVVQLDLIGSNRCIGLTQAGQIALFKGENGILLPSPQGRPLVVAGNSTMLACATFHPSRKEIVISIIRPGGEAISWQAIADFPSGDSHIHLLISDDNVIFVGAGKYVRQISTEDGQSKTVVVASQPAPIVSMTHFGGVTAVASVESIWVNADGKAWQSVAPFPNAEAIADIQLSQSNDKLCLNALTGDGRLWAIQLDQ